MFVELWHQSDPVFPDDPGGFVAVLVVFESVINPDSGHPNIDAGLRCIAFRIQPNDGRVLGDSIAEQNHIHVVMKRLFLLGRASLRFQSAGASSALLIDWSALLRVAWQKVLIDPSRACRN